MNIEYYKTGLKLERKNEFQICELCLISLITS